MPRLATATLLSGSTVLLAILYLYFATLTPADSPPGRVLDPASATIVVGAAAPGKRGLGVTLDGSGVGVVHWNLPGLRAADYILLDIDIAPPRSATTLALFWKTAKTGDALLYYTLPGGVDPDIHAIMQLSEWQGTIGELGFVIRGAPGETILLESAQLLARSPANLSRYTLSEWLATGEWNQSSINAYYGVGSNSALLRPLPVIAGLLFASFCCYLLIVFISKRVDFDWRVPAVIFVTCWVGLDLLWQGTLLDRLGNTRSQFASLASESRREVGPEAPLFAFVGDARRRMTPAGARVFVSSRDDYIGMRGAYYLYPFNVYWNRSGPELPEPRYLHKGDYLLVLAPTALRFDQQQKVLVSPEGGRVAVAVETAAAAGTLYRVI